MKTDIGTERHARTIIACAVILQLIVAGSLLTYGARIRHQAEAQGRTVTLACTAYDPFNPFKGRYVRLTIEEATIDRERLDEASIESLTHAPWSRTVYCRMEQTDGQLWTVTGIRKRLPRANGYLYIKAVPDRTDYIQDVISGRNKLHLSYRFTEYYLQENYARLVDGIQWNDFNALEPQLTLFVGRNGSCIQQGLTVLDGTERISIEEYCRRRL